jgi:hypothetical protein
MLWNVVLINSLIAFVILCSQWGNGRHPITNDQIPYIVAVVNALYLFVFIVWPPPKYIKVDKKAQVINYCYLFRSQVETVKYKRIRSSWKTQHGARGSSWMELGFYIDEQNLFTITPGLMGWTKAELSRMHLYVSKK